MPTIRLRTTPAAAAIVCASLLAAVAAASPARPASAAQFLASAQQRDERALDALRASAQVTPAGIALIRAASTDLDAALDLLGAAELKPQTTSAVGLPLAAAAKAHRRALGRSRSLKQILGDLELASRHERQAAARLGDAPGTPGLTELQIPLTPFGAFDLALAQDGRSLWVSGADGGRILLYPSLDADAKPQVFKLAPGQLPPRRRRRPRRRAVRRRDGDEYRRQRDRAVHPDRRAPRVPPTGRSGRCALGNCGRVRRRDLVHRGLCRQDRACSTRRPASSPSTGCRRRTASRRASSPAPGGALWGTEVEANRIFRMTVDGHATEFRIPTPRSVPASIAVGRGGVLWVSEFSSGEVVACVRVGPDARVSAPEAAGARTDYVCT